MFRIAICDDEKYFAEELKDLLSCYMLEKGAVFEIDTYSSGEDLAALGIGIAKYTIIFLDINMERTDGIRTAEMIREVSREVFIVFVTAYVDYALEGYRLDAVRYLLKSNDNFQNTVNECMDAVMDKLNYSVVKMEFKFREGTRKILPERVLYVESSLHKLEFHVMEDTVKVYSMYEKLDDLEDRLAGNDFIRIHQSYLANMKHIKNVVHYKAVMSDGTELAIARARYAFVEEKFISYQGEV